MNPRHRPRHLPSRLLVAIFPALVSTSSSAQEVRIDCGAMTAMAAQAYSEIYNAISAQDYRSAYRLKNVFWEIEKYGGKCKDVRGLGKKLSENRLGPKDSYTGPPKVSSTIVTDPGSFGATGSAGNTASSPEGSVSGFSGSSGTSSASGSVGTTGTTGSAGTSSTSGTSTQSTGRQDGPD